jgi:hypothetical protein
MNAVITSCAFALGMVLGLSACTDPYDPDQRAFGAVACSVQARELPSGGIAGGGRGAATGALLGGALGAIGGAATTPSPGSYGRSYYGSTTALATTDRAMAPAMTDLATMGPATTATAIRGSDVTRACVGAAPR